MAEGDYLTYQNTAQGVFSILGFAVGMYTGYAFADYIGLKGLAKAIIVGAGGTVGNYIGLAAGKNLVPSKKGEYLLPEEGEEAVGVAGTVASTTATFQAFEMSKVIASPFDVIYTTIAGTLAYLFTLSGGKEVYKALKIEKKQKKKTKKEEDEESEEEEEETEEIGEKITDLWDGYLSIELSKPLT